MELLVPFVLMSIFMAIVDLVALKWGVDSREDLYSPEWIRRANRGYVL